MPPSDHQLEKNIAPEIINQQFMWVDDYFHYADWKQQQQGVFDSFNLLEVPRKQGDFKYFYNRGTKQRIVPQGIFPNPNMKRVVLEPPVNKMATRLNEGAGQGDAI